jgi:hypothetical protein
MSDENKIVPLWPGWCAGVAAGILISQHERSSKWSLQSQLVCSAPLAVVATGVATAAYLANSIMRWHRIAETGDAMKLLANRVPSKGSIRVHVLPSPVLAAVTIWWLHGKALSETLSPVDAVIHAFTKNDSRIRALESKALEQDFKLAELLRKVESAGKK